MNDFVKALIYLDNSEVKRICGDIALEVIKSGVFYGYILDFNDRFAIFDDDGNLEFLIEFQGKQHYQAVSKFGGARGLYQQKYNDTLKRRYCAFHGIKLVEIPYTDEEIITYDYIMSKADLF